MLVKSSPPQQDDRGLNRSLGKHSTTELSCHQYCISLLNTNIIYGLGWDIGPKNHTRADALFNHAMYNQTIFRQHLKPQFKYIVPTREPVSLFFSAVKFFGRNNVFKAKTVNFLRKSNI